MREITIEDLNAKREEIKKIIKNLNIEYIIVFIPKAKYKYRDVDLKIYVKPNLKPIFYWNGWNKASFEVRFQEVFAKNVINVKCVTEKDIRSLIRYRKIKIGEFFRITYQASKNSLDILSLDISPITNSGNSTPKSNTNKRSVTPGLSEACQYQHS